MNSFDKTKFKRISNPDDYSDSLLSVKLARVILIAGNWAFLPICYRVLDLFWDHNIFHNLLLKMTAASRFSRQNDAALRALNVVQWENLVLVVVLS